MRCEGPCCSCFDFAFSSFFQAGGLKAGRFPLSSVSQCHTRGFQKLDFNSPNQPLAKGASHLRASELQSFRASRFRFALRDVVHVSKPRLLFCAFCPDNLIAAWPEGRASGGVTHRPGQVAQSPTCPKALTRQGVRVTRVTRVTRVRARFGSAQVVTGFAADHAWPLCDAFGSEPH